MISVALILCSTAAPGCVSCPEKTPGTAVLHELRRKVAALTMLFVIGGNLQAADGDWQMWTETSWRQNLGNGLDASLRFEPRWTRDISRFSYYELEAMVQWRWSPRWDFGLGYERNEQLETPSSVHHVPNLDVTWKLPLRAWNLSNRSRMEFAVPENSNADWTPTYRNRMEFGTRWRVGGGGSWSLTFLKNPFLISGKETLRRIVRAWGLAFRLFRTGRRNCTGCAWTKKRLLDGNGIRFLAFKFRQIFNFMHHHSTRFCFGDHTRLACFVRRLVEQFFRAMGKIDEPLILDTRAACAPHSFPRRLFTGIMLVATAVILASCQPTSAPNQTGDVPGIKKSERKVGYYTCSMHPQVHADKPGDCPICGMTLIPVYLADSSGSNSVSHSQGEIHLNPEGIRQASVSTEPVAKRVLSKDLLIFGSLGYDMNLHRDVVPLVEGRVEKQFIDFNQTEAKRGDPLVSLYSQEGIRLQEEYLKTLRERWLSTFYERDLLDSMVALAGEKLKKIGFTDADLTRLSEDKKVTPNVTVRSPISGSIVGNMVHIGELAKIDVPLYHIVPLDELWFNAQVFEPDLGLLKLGQTVRITTKSFPGEVFAGKLSFIGRALDASNRTVPVRFTVPNADRRLLPNLSASGSLDIPLGEDLLSVPNSAVLDLGTRHVVYVEKEKGVYLPRNVRIGHVTSHYTQILEGLSAGDEAVTSGAFLIDAQAQLRGAAMGVDTPKEQASESPISPPSMPPGHQH